MLATVLEILGAALLLYGVWHREDLIAFEDRLFGRIAALLKGTNNE